MVLESEAFRSIRKKLDVLGYREPLGEESLLLVRRLLDDLIVATHGLQESKCASSSKLISELEGKCSTLEAENSTLRDECLCLNKSVVQIHESYKAQIQELIERSRSLEHNNHELQTLNWNFMGRLRALGLDPKELIKPTDNNPNASVFGTHCPRLDSHKNSGLDGFINSNLNSSDPVSSCIGGHAQPCFCSGGESLNGLANANPSETNNLVKTLTKRCCDLESNISLLQKERELTEKRTATFKKQIEVRDEEIDRLRGIIGGEMSLEKLALDTQQGHTDRMIGELQSQVDLLRKRNEELEKRMFLRLDAISQSAFAVSSTRECASQCELLKHPIDGKVDRYELAELFDNFEKTSSHFFSRTDELVNSQKKMVLEIERLKRLVPPAKKPAQPLKQRATRSAVKKPLSPPSTALASTNADVATAKQTTEDYEPPIKEYMEGLLADRETLRAQVDYLNRSLRRWFTMGASFIATTDDAREGCGQNAYAHTVHLGVPEGDHERDEASVGREFTSEMLRALLKATESERDYYIRRTDELQVEISRLTYLSNHHYHQSQSDAHMNPKIDAEFEAVKQERDELHMALNQFEQNLLKIQAEVRSLRSERDQLLLELEKAQKSAASSKSPTLFTGLTGSEHTLALDYQGKNNAVSNPNTSPRVGASTEGGKQLRGDVSGLQAALADSRTQLEASRRRTDELEVLVEKLKCQVDEMTSQKEEAEKLKDQLQTALVQTNARNSSLVSELSMRKNMCNEALRGKQLSDAMVAEAQRDLQSLNASVVELDAEIRRSNEEVSRLRKVASQLDAEKDALQASLDDRTEDLITLKRDFDRRTRLFEENKQYLNSVELRLRQVTEMAAERDREVQALTKRLHEAQASSQVVNCSRDISEEKYAKAKADITVLSNEVQSLKTNLQTARNENNDLHRRLAEALQTVSSSDQALDVKLKEHKDLLTQYSSLNKEFEAMSKRNVELERTLADLEEALQGKEAAVRSYIDRAQKAEFAALSAKRECVLAEEKCIRLSTVAEKAESRAQELNGEVEEVRRDLAATRNLAGALQARLDNTAGQAVSTASDLTTKLAECESKLRNALDETAHQRELVQQLECLLAVARENQVRLQASLDRKTEECDRLLKDTHSAHQAVGLATTEAMMLHNQFITNLRHDGSAGLTTTSVTQTAVPSADGQDHPLLFYKPLHPTPSTSSTVSLPLESNHVVTAISSAATTPTRSPTCRPASSGTNKSPVRFYEPSNVSESCSTNPSLT